MMNPERWRPVFMFAFTTIGMIVLGLWLAWVRDTERWGLLAIYFAVMALIIWRYWNYRPPG